MTLTPDLIFDIAWAVVGVIFAYHVIRSTFE